MRAARIALGALGVLVMAYALGGAIADPDDALAGHLAFLLGVLAAHDAVVLPLAIGVGALSRRYLRGRAVAAVQGGLVVTAAVLVVGLPLALGYGRTADNPSALPRNYPLGLLLVLAAVWLAVGVALVGRSGPRRAAWVKDRCPPR